MEHLLGEAVFNNDGSRNAGLYSMHSLQYLSISFSPFPDKLISPSKFQKLEAPLLSPLITLRKGSTAIFTSIRKHLTFNPNL